MPEEPVQGPDFFPEADDEPTDPDIRNTGVRGTMEELLAAASEDRATITQYEQTLKELQDKERRLRESLASAHAKNRELSVTNEELKEAVDLLSTTPNQYGTIVRVLSNQIVDVQVGETRHRVGVSPSVLRADLRVGAQAVLSGKTFSVIEVDGGYLPTGTRAKLAELATPELAVIEDSRGEKRTAIVSAAVPTSALTEGAEILLHHDVVVQAVAGGAGVSLGSAARFMLAEMPDVTFDDIGGLDAEVADIIDALEDPLRIPEGYEALNKKKTFSTLFIGLPGNGKTMLAKAIARRSFDLHKDAILKVAKGNFFTITGTEMYDKWLGNTEGFLRSVAGAAERLYELTGALSFIFFDDCEAFFLTRSEGLSTNINGSVVTQFSGMMDGIRALKGVCVIAASNRPDLMDQAILRRFDIHTPIKPPDTPERASAVLSKLLQRVPFDGIERGAAIDELVRAIFAEGPDNEVVEVTYAGADESDGESEEEIIYLHQMISGKLLRDVVERAKTLALKRVKALPLEQRVWALTMGDLKQALELEIQTKESLPANKETVTEWLRQRGTKTKVDMVVNLRERRAAEEKRDARIDRSVL